MAQAKQPGRDKSLASLHKATDTLSTMLAQEVKELNARQKVQRADGSDPALMKGLKEATAVLKDLAAVAKTLNDQGADAEARGVRRGASASRGGRMNAEIVWRPSPGRRSSCAARNRKALYGGAAGGGKSDALVIEALRQVHIPHYRGLILRKTYPSSVIWWTRAWPTTSGLFYGAVQRHQPCVGVPQRGKDLLWFHAVHQGPHKLSGQGFRLSSGLMS